MNEEVFLITKNDIERFLSEDVGRGDITTNSIIMPDQKGSGVLVARESFVLAGIDAAIAVFKYLDPDLEAKKSAVDGDRVESGTQIATLKGDLKSLLIGERTALNLLQRMSGIATTASAYAVASNGKVRVLDTRKTAPGLRKLDKYAVRVGGCFNHRFGLDDGILIKDNHIKAAGSIFEAMKRVKEKSGGHLLKIQVEVDNINELHEAIGSGADGVMLDNMSDDEIKKAVEIANGKVFVEASGGITLQRVKTLCEVGVDFISVGALTHSSRAVNISFDL